MFNIIGELWKAQQYAMFECNFEVPQTFYLQGSKISHYFTSIQCSGKILKKRKENVSLKSILEIFNSKEKYVCSFSRLLNKQEVIVRYLTRTELETLVQDVTNFSELYQDVILQQIFPSENFITYKRQGHVTQIQQRIPLAIEPLITLKDSQYVCEKVVFENRVNKVGQNIENLLILCQGSKFNEIELFFKYFGDKLIIVWNTILAKKQLNFTSTMNYLYNQELYEKFQPKVQEQIEMVQCGSCRKLIKINDSFEVLKNKIWKIRMHRNLHHLNDQKIICDANGRIQPRLDEFQFIRVCGLCYNSFIETISNNKKTETSRQKQTQEYSQLQILRPPRRKMFKLGDKDARSYLGSRTNSTQLKDRRMTPQLINSTFDENYESIQCQRMELDNDFDVLLNEVKNDLRSSYQPTTKVSNKTRIQSAQQNKFKLYYQ